MSNQATVIISGGLKAKLPGPGSGGEQSQSARSYCADSLSVYRHVVKYCTALLPDQVEKQCFLFACKLSKKETDALVKEPRLQDKTNHKRGRFVS
jgi:hypothetical protein